MMWWWFLAGFIAGLLVAAGLVWAVVAGYLRGDWVAPTYIDDDG